MYHDVDKVFYKELNGGGAVHRGSLLEMLWPWSAAWRRIRDASSRVKEHNLVSQRAAWRGTCVRACESKHARGEGVATSCCMHGRSLPCVPALLKGVASMDALA